MSEDVISVVCLAALAIKDRSSASKAELLTRHAVSSVITIIEAEMPAAGMTGMTWTKHNLI